ncbi:helix-turn-helix domain-containing protein [Inhella proteolytica]|uniref:Helix-turn-helix transcriptional regulator n=1 Tax=Inhella proteolytica TaxID=2795029 RepID=A0A931J333_9BURK|nr:AraC family transcriptional regulator [Inhella proteolytica]MBH9578679.1 helix-turn-helix transcriptional regulator [Inhella proteolytica]
MRKIVESELLCVFKPQGADADFVPWIIWRRAGPSSSEPLESTVPANVYCCLHFSLTGREYRLGPDGWRPLPACYLAGPATRPFRLRSESACESISIVLQPWVARAIFNVDGSRVVDSHLPRGDLGALATELMARIEELKEPFTPETALPMLVGPLLRDCHRMQTTLGQHHALVKTFARQGSVAATAKALGLTVDLFSAVFRDLTGLRPARWRRLNRAELLVDSLANSAAQNPRLCELGKRAGFSDPAHVSRELRQISGMAPSAIREVALGTDPGHWPLARYWRSAAVATRPA